MLSVLDTNWLSYSYQNGYNLLIQSKIYGFYLDSRLRKAYLFRAVVEPIASVPAAINHLIWQICLIALPRIPPKLQRRCGHYAVLSANMYHGLLKSPSKLWLVAQE